MGLSGPFFYIFFEAWGRGFNDRFPLSTLGLNVIITYPYYLCLASAGTRKRFPRSLGSQHHFKKTHLFRVARWCLEVSFNVRFLVELQIPALLLSTSQQCPVSRARNSGRCCFASEVAQDLVEDGVGLQWRPIAALDVQVPAFLKSSRAKSQT